MKQVDEDMLIIKAMVGDDFERMNNLIIEMQKSYQDYFRKSQQELVNAMSSMGAVIVHTNQDIVRVFDCQSKSYKSFKLSSVTEFVGNNKVLK